MKGPLVYPSVRVNSISELFSEVEFTWIWLDKLPDYGKDANYAVCFDNYNKNDTLPDYVCFFQIAYFEMAIVKNDSINCGAFRQVYYEGISALDSPDPNQNLNSIDDWSNVTYATLLKYTT